LAGLEPGWRVLDVGCGIGGPARLLAQRFGCQVSGIDLTPAYCHVATRLSQMVGLDEHTDFRVADALALPFAADRFDAVWTQHVSMNVADKAGFYGELARVLRPGGRLAIYDVAAGSGDDLRFPLPWAGSAATSFLAGTEAMRGQIEAAGLIIETWQDATQPALNWFAKVAGKPAPPLGLQVLVGPDWGQRVANLSHNLEASKIVLLQIVARNPGG
jgi:ubiquinone/menaquinone biosynthesis C-methylase UbiE